MNIRAGALVLRLLPTLQARYRKALQTWSTRVHWGRSISHQRFFRRTTSACLALLVACSPKEKPAATADHSGFATRYAAAWSGKDPVSFGALYEENGSLTVNGSASVGRAAIVETARSYMAAFPDMVVRLDSLREETGATVFHWTWTGTNTGPGGTGKAVNLQGYERWTFGPNGLLLASDGHFDDAEYQRQLKGESGTVR